MAANRATPTIVTHPSGRTGQQYTDDVAEEIAALWNLVFNQVGSVGGTANAITGTCSTPLTGAPTHGQTFRLTPAASNSGAVTINLDSTGALALVDEDGNALATGDIVSGRPITFWKDDTISKFRLGQPTLNDINAGMSSLITASSLWAQIGHTDISVAAASVEHLFTADAYTQILIIIQGLSVSNGVGTTDLIVTLRYAGGALVTLTFSALFPNASAPASGRVNFFLDTSGAASRLHLGDATMVCNSVIASQSGFSLSASVPDRIRIAANTGNVDLGRISVYGLKKTS